MRISRHVVYVLIFLCCWGMEKAMAQEGDTLRVGIIPYKTPQQIIETYTPLFEYVGRQIDRPMKVSLVNEDDLGYLLANKSFDLGVFTPFPYLRAKADFPSLEVFASHIVEGEDHLSGAILASKNGPIKEISDLRGRNMQFVKPTSTSGFLYPKGILAEYDLDLENGDITYQFSGGHDLSLQSLERNETDAIAIDIHGLPEEAPSVDNFLRLYSYTIPYHAYVFSPTIPSSLKQQILQVMLSADKDPDIRVALHNELGIEKWVARNDNYYNPLRRYLQFTRIKPAIRPRIDTKASARASFAKTGDMLDVLMDNIINELKESDRFLVTTIDNQNNFHELRLDVSMIQNVYQCQIYLDNTRIEYFTNIDLDNLQREIPKAITQAVLSEFTIETEMLRKDSIWFITYGTEDGINIADYEFVLLNEDGSEAVLRKDQMLSMDERHTYFKDTKGLTPEQKIEIRYHGKEFKTNLTSSMPEKETNKLDRFWDDKDNQWGIIGLVVTLIGVIIGGYFTRKKQKLFRNMLYESNQLLLEYIRGHYKLDNEVIAHKEKINQFLEKGHITENQYLILKHRIEDIHNIIQQILKEPESLDKNLRNEVKDIIEDGVLTEKEYSRLVALVQQNKPTS